MRRAARRWRLSIVGRHPRLRGGASAAPHESRAKGHRLPWQGGRAQLGRASHSQRSRSHRRRRRARRGCSGACHQRASQRTEESVDSSSVRACGAARARSAAVSSKSRNLLSEKPSAVTAGSSACRLPYFPPASATDHRLRPPRLRPLPRLRTAAATAAHRLPAPLAARAQPAAASRHFGHTDPTVPHPLFSDAVGVVFRCWVPTSRCRARLTPHVRRLPALAARSLGGTPQLTASGESYRASPALSA